MSILDCDGVPLSVGDRVRHTTGRWGDKYHDEHKENPKDPKWRSDGFEGFGVIVDVHSITVALNTPMGRRVHAGAFLRSEP